MKQFWTKEEIEYLLINYPDMQTKIIAEKLGKKVFQVYNKAFILRLKKTEEYNNSPDSGRLTGKDTRGLSERFKKGSIPWNKGTKGVMKSNSGTFKKGDIPKNTKYYGQPHVRDYVRNGKIKLIWEIQPLGCKKRSYLKWLWEREVSKLEKGEIIVFKDKPFFNRPPLISELKKITRRENLIRNTGVGELSEKFAETILKRQGIKFPSSELIEMKMNQLKINREIINNEKAN